MTHIRSLLNLTVAASLVLVAAACGPASSQRAPKTATLMVLPPAKAAVPVGENGFTASDCAYYFQTEGLHKGPYATADDATAGFVDWVNASGFVLSVDATVVRKCTINNPVTIVAMRLH